MKKFLLVCVIAINALTIGAQSLSITYGETDITNDTVFLSIPLDQLVDEYFDVNNLTASDMSCHVKRYVECTPTYFIHNWCFGILCYSGSIFEINANILASQFLEFHVGPMPMTDNDHGYIHRYNFYSNSNPADSVWFWIVNDPNGDCTASSQMLVNAAKTKAKVYPNPADQYTNFDYKVNTTNSSLYIFNIIGEKVMTVKLTGKEGVAQINTSNLPSGTYIATVVESGIRTKSVKIIVSH